VGKALRNVEHRVVMSSKNQTEILFKRRGLGPQINDCVIDRAPRASHQLRLCVGGDLVVHPAQRALLLAKRNTALRQAWVQAVHFELPLAPGTCEEPSIVFPFLWLYDEGTRESGLGENHWSKQ
jgi:hypothetical protein